MNMGWKLRFCQLLTHLKLWHPERARFANEIHDHKEDVRSSNQLLTAAGTSNSSQETGALNSIKETCASTPFDPIGDSFFKKTVILRCERKCMTIEANPFPRRDLLKYPRWFVSTIRMNVKKMDHIIVTLWNHYCCENLHRKEKDALWVVLDSSDSSRPQ